MITTQYAIRLDLKGKITYAKADRRLTMCHEVLYPEKKPISVESMSGNSVCDPYISVVVEDRKQAVRIEKTLKNILGRWLDA